MNHTDIRKMEISDLDLALAKERVGLAEKAKTLLGYSNLRTGNTLIDKLHELGINPLNKTDVRDYMRSKEKTYFRKSTKIWLAYGLTFAVLAYLGCHYDTPYFGMPAAFLGVVGFIGLGGLFDGTFVSPKRWTEWHMTSLSSYGSQVPEHILAKAVQIKEACPTASFYVHHLDDMIEQRPPRMTRDPFLEVRLGNESYFVDVWDEKDFVEA